MLISGKNGKREIAGAFLCAAGIVLLGGCGKAGEEIPSVSGNGQNAEEASELKITEDSFDEYEIVLPGCKGEYELMFLTDLHISLPAQDSDEVRAYVDERREMFTAQGGNGVEASDHLRAFLEFGEERGVDALLLGGDIIDSPSTGNLDFLEDALSSTEIPYLYALGNHDWTYPWDYMTPEGKEAYLPLLAPYMKENVWFSTMEFEDFFIVCMDNSSNQFSPEALEACRQVLEAEKPVILLCHVPLLTEPLLEEARKVWTGEVLLGISSNGGIYPNEVSSEVINLILAEDSPVFLILAGHVHFPASDTLDGGILQIVGDAGYKGRGALLHISGGEEE